MPKIIVIGGGIAGLATALALNKLGIRSLVYEKAPRLNEVGAGIWMAPNAMKVLERLGIAGRVRAHGSNLQSVEITDRKLKPIRHSRHAFITDEKGNAITSIHRARLQKILYESLPSGQVLLGREYLGHSEGNGRIEIRFAGGEETADILLGADGIRSKVRAALFGDTVIRYSGQTCWRGIADIALPDRFTSACREAWGHMVRFGFSAISEDQVYWFAVEKAPQGQVEGPTALKPKLNGLFKDFHPLIHQIIEATPADRIIRNDISDLKPLSAWHRRNVCLIGDAAHATTPNMGQGGAQGVEDAWYVANLLSRAGDAEDAFRAFESARRKKVNAVVTMSWMMGKLIHQPVGQAMLKLVNKLTPDRVVAKQMQTLYAVKEF